MNTQPKSNVLGNIIAVLLLILAVKFIFGMVAGLIKLVLTVAALAALVGAVYWFYQQRKPVDNTTLDA